MSKEAFDSSTFAGTLWQGGSIFNLAAGGTYSLGFIPESRSSMEGFTLSSTSSSTNIAVYENSSFSGGSAPLIESKNRRTTLERSFNAVSDPVITDLGNKILSSSAFATNQSIGSLGGESLFLMADSVPYIVQITNNDSAAADYSFDYLIDAPAREGL